MKEFVLDASFALHWCFEDEATAQTESILTLLQAQEAIHMKAECAGKRLSELFTLT